MHYHLKLRVDKFAKMEVKVISSDKIKPSSPTPSHLRTFKLSYHDQLQPKDLFCSINFFYSRPTSSTETTLVEQLKVSLSKTLTRFYPLAARITKDDNISIECDDEGALFTHVELSCHMSNFLKQPINHNLLCVGADDADAGVQLTIRLNVFACGGIWIGVRFFHKIIDGATISAFLKSWAATAINGATSCASNNVIDEDDLRVASRLFPPNENHKSTEINRPKNMIKGVWERFVFDAEAISTLKSIFIQDNQNPPSGVIVVSSFVLKHVIAAAYDHTSTSNSAPASQKQYLLSIGVNMRPRMDPPLSENSIGNMALFTGVLSPLITSNKKETEIMKLVAQQQREAIADINGDFLARIQGEGGYEVMKKISSEKIKMIFGRGVEVEVCSCVSWCKFGFNELDFGWGKPLWHCNEARVPSTASFLNHFLFIDTPSGDGIEAQLILDEAQMTMLKLDQDFLALASINPNILP